MTESIATTCEARLQELFYRCKFSELLRELECLQARTGELDAEQALLKSNALFELHRVPEARQTLKDVSAAQDDKDAAYLYALARLCYFDDAPSEARALFTEIAARATTPRYRFRSLLGIANTYYTEENFAPLPALIDQLRALEPLPRADERISLTIFLGNYYLASGQGSHMAKQYFRKALTSATLQAWTYFITRCFYGMAAVCEKEGQMAELMWTLDVLAAFVDQSEQRFFSHVINRRFKSHSSINTPMEFDTVNQRILINNTWLPFQGKPLLFHFLLLLRDRDTFVDKEAIARDLWPHDSYKPRVHDPRICDIAKRARNLIESYENQPTVLLSGRMGYKLASA